METKQLNEEKLYVISCKDDKTNANFYWIQDHHSWNPNIKKATSFSRESGIFEIGRMHVEGLNTFSKQSLKLLPINEVRHFRYDCSFTPNTDGIKYAERIIGLIQDWIEETKDLTTQWLSK